MYSCNDEECAHDELCQTKCELEWHKEYLAEQKMVYEAEKEMANKENSENFIVVVVALVVAVLIIFE